MVEANGAVFPGTMPARYFAISFISVIADAAVVVLQVKNHSEPAACALHAHEVDRALE